MPTIRRRNGIKEQDIYRRNNIGRSNMATIRNVINEVVVPDVEIIDGNIVFHSPLMYHRFLLLNNLYRRINYGRSNIATTRRRNGINDEDTYRRNNFGRSNMATIRNVINEESVPDVEIIDSNRRINYGISNIATTRRRNETNEEGTYIGRSNMATIRNVINEEVVPDVEIIDGNIVFHSPLMYHRYLLLNNLYRRIHYGRSNIATLRNVINEEGVANGEMIDGDLEMESSECSICLRVMGASKSNSNTIFRMPQPHPCSHAFHYHCIVRWLQIKNTCPLCRRNIHL